MYTNNYDGSLNYKQGFPVFNTLIHANHITNKDKLASDALNDGDIKVIFSSNFSSGQPSSRNRKNIRMKIFLLNFVSVMSFTLV